MTDIRRQLITYAVASHAVMGSQDLLTGLMPFFEPIVNEMGGEVFDPSKFITRVKELYDWPINEDVVLELIPRMQKEGWLESLGEHQGVAAYKCKTEKLNQYDKIKISVENDLREISILFKNFYEELSPIRAVTFTIEELEEILLKWLVTFDGFDRSAVISSAEKLLHENNKEDNTDIGEEEFFNPSMDSGHRYICAKFLKYLEQSNPDFFDKIVDVTSVALLTEVVLDIQTPPDKDRISKDLIVVFDAPLVMDALGVSGDASQARVNTIIAALKGLEAQIVVFSHSCKEMQRNLKAVLSTPVHERHGPTGDAIKRGELFEDYAWEVLKDTEHFISKVTGFQIIDSDVDSYPNSHKFFPEELYEEFYSRVNWHDHGTPSERDAASVTVIMRRRGGKRTRDPLYSKFLMISRNWLFCEFSRKFCQEYGLITEPEVGPLIHQRTLAALLWLTVGSEEKRELSRRQVLASCEKVLRLRPNVIQKACDTLKASRPEHIEQLENLLSRPRSIQILTDQTLNVERIISSENIDDLFKMMRESAAEDIREKSNEKITIIREEHDRELNTLRGDISEKTQLIDEQQDFINELHVAELSLVEGWVSGAKNLEKKWVLGQQFFIVLVTIISGGAGLYLEGDSASFIVIISFLIFVLAVVQILPWFPNFLKPFVDKKRNKLLVLRAEEVGRSELLSSVTVNWTKGKVDWKVKERDISD